MGFVKKAVLVILIVVTLLFVFASLLLSKYNIAVNSNESYNFSDKLNSIVLGGECVEFTKQEINYLTQTLINSNEEVKNLVKKSYINTEEKKLDLTAQLWILKHDFYVNVLIKPYIDKNYLNIQVQKVRVGKITIPSNLVMHEVKRFFSPYLKIGSNNTIIIDKSILSAFIKNINIDNDKVSIYLEKSPVNFLDNTENSGEPSDNNSKTNTNNNNSKSNTNQDIEGNYSSKENQKLYQESNKSKQDDKNLTSKGSKQDFSSKSVNNVTDIKVNALKTVYGQLNYVLKDVQSKEGRLFVEKVISLGSNMIKNPDENFNSELSQAFAAYQMLPEKYKNEVVSSAYKNIDFKAAEQLVEFYNQK